MKPDECTSLKCSESHGGCDYCKRCSHGIFYGKGTDKTGKHWSWSFNSYSGVIFLSKRKNMLKKQPEENSPAWEIFGAWHDKRFKIEK